MTYRVWICERCKGHHTNRNNIWDCVRCNKECCESCFDRYAHCKDCAGNKSNVELCNYANERGYDFEPHNR